MKRMRACMAKAPMRHRKSSILSLRTCTKPAVSAAFACLRTWLDLVQLGQAALLRRFVREGLVGGENFVGGSSPTPNWTSTLRVNEYTALGASSNGKQQQA